MSLKMLLLDLTGNCASEMSNFTTEHLVHVTSLAHPSEAISSFFREDWDVVIVSELSFSGRVQDIAKAFSSMPRRDKSIFLLFTAEETNKDIFMSSGFFDNVFSLSSDLLEFEMYLEQKKLIDYVKVFKPVAVKKDVDSTHQGVHEKGEIGELNSVSKSLLRLAETRFTGQLKLENQKNISQITFVKGLVVAANENAVETRLGAMLIQKGMLSTEKLQESITFGQENKLRLAESIIRLKYLPISEILTALKAQTHERCIRAVGWNAGLFTIEEQEIDVEKQTVTQFDVRDAILSWICRAPANKNVLNLWLKESSQFSLRKSLDYLDGIEIYNRIRPDSILISLLEEPHDKTYKIAQRIKSHYKDDSKKFLQCMNDLYALHKADIIFLNAEEKRFVKLPLIPKVENEVIEQHQAENARKLQELWLKVQGRDYFEILGKSYEASCSELKESIQNFTVTHLRNEKVQDIKGEAHTLSAKLSGMLAEMEWTLCDEEKKQEYLISLNLPVQLKEDEMSTETQKNQQNEAFEQDLEVAEIASRNEDWHTAKIILDELKKNLPGNARVEANWAFVELHLSLSTARDFLTRLEMVQESNPETGDFLYLLGKARSLLGNDEAAIEDLLSAKQKCPYATYIDIALEKLVSESQMLDDDDDDDDDDFF